MRDHSLFTAISVVFSFICIAVAQLILCIIFWQLGRKKIIDGESDDENEHPKVEVVDFDEDAEL